MVLQKTTRASKPPKTKSIFGFTLIELIVVITILAILGTIGFLSIWGYSSKARDSARIGDVAQISKSLDVSIVTRDSYPLPDNYFAITYSGGTLWNQWVIGSSVMQFLRTSISWGGLNKKPVDPLDNSEYVYSSLAFGKSYQIQAIYEGDMSGTALHLPNLTTEVLAAPGSPTISYIKGNFGGLMARTVTGSHTYVLAIPSIITNTGSTSTPKIEIANTNTLSGTLLFHGRALKAASTFNPSSLAPVYTSTGGLPTTTSQIELLMTSLKTAYSGTGTPADIKSNTAIASLLTMNTGSLTTLGTNLVKNDLGGVGVSGGQTLVTETPLYTFTNHTFTNCWATGKVGPSVATCRTTYNWTEVNAWKATYLNMVTNGIQEWTVPSTWTYRIRALGAQWWQWTSYIGWYGIDMTWDFSLIKWDIIKLLVGQPGGNNSSYKAGGGGGGTYVTKIDNTILIIAGGGGGGGWNSNPQNWQNGLIGSDGWAWSQISFAGWIWWSGGNTGGGSWGWAGYSGNGWGSSCAGVTSSLSFLAWWTWWNKAVCTAWDFGWDGWFWWGGGGDWCCAWATGGGGWYSGGGGTSSSWVAGGGGSFNNWTNQSNSVNSGSNGSVVITKL